VAKLLERESELAAIRSVLRRSGALVVEGHAGIGKTAILEAACLAASRRQRLVLRARL
jgi:MoxR-like ATPase